MAETMPLSYSMLAVSEMLSWLSSTILNHHLFSAFLTPLVCIKPSRYWNILVLERCQRLNLISIA